MAQFYVDIMETARTILIVNFAIKYNALVRLMVNGAKFLARQSLTANNFPMVKGIEVWFAVPCTEVVI